MCLCRWLPNVSAMRCGEPLRLLPPQGRFFPSSPMPGGLRGLAGSPWARGYACRPQGYRESPGERHLAGIMLRGGGLASSFHGHIKARAGGWMGEAQPVPLVTGVLSLTAGCYIYIYGVYTFAVCIYIFGVCVCIYTHIYGMYISGVYVSGVWLPLAVLSAPSPSAAAPPASRLLPG